MIHAYINKEFKRLKTKEQSGELDGYEDGVLVVFGLLRSYKDDNPFLENCIRKYIAQYDTNNHTLTQYEVSGTKQYRMDYQKGITETLRKLYLILLLNNGFLDVNTINNFMKNK